MTRNNLKLAGKRIGVFGKGGSGKSTFTILLAMALQERGYEVCVLDADSTNVGLPQAFGVKTPAQTLLDYYGGMVFSGGQVTCPVDDPTPLNKSQISLDTLSDQFYATNKDGITILSAGKIGRKGPGAGCDGPISKIARDLQITMADRQPITLIDFKAGFEDSARGVMTNLDWAIVVVDPTTASIEIAANMSAMVDQIKAGVLPATAHLESDELIEIANRIFTQARITGVHIVLNRVPSAEIEDHLYAKLAQHDIKPIGVIHNQALISLAWLEGKPVQSMIALGETHMIVDRLEDDADGYS